MVIVTFEDKNSADRNSDVIMVMPRNAFPYTPVMEDELALEAEENIWYVLNNSEKMLSLSLMDADDYGMKRKALHADWSEAGKQASLDKRQKMLEAALAAAGAFYRQTPGKYPLYIRLSAQDLDMIAMLSRLKLIPYFGQWSHASQEQSEADWQVITEALRAASEAGVL